MKLWLLRPRMDEDTTGSPWHPWYDKCFGFVVRAESERAAREIAQASAGDEVRPPRFGGVPRPVWTDLLLASCVELTPEGEPGVVIEDVHAA